MATFNQQGANYSGPTTVVNIGNGTFEMTNEYGGKEAVLPEVSPSLHYLVNRTKQEKEILKVMKLNREEKFNAPVLFIIPGVEEQSHLGMYICYEERIMAKKFILPIEEMNLDKPDSKENQKEQPKTKHSIQLIKWPHADDERDLDCFLEAFDDDRLSLNGETTSKAFQEAVKNEKNHLTFKTNVFSENWEKLDENLIDDLIKFWLGLPNEENGKLLALFISFRYTWSDDELIAKQNELSLIKEKEDRKELEELLDKELRMRVFVRSLQEDLGEKKNFKILTELNNIRKGDVVEWVDGPVKKECIEKELGYDLPVIEDNAVKGFKNKPRKPMAEVSVELESILQEARRRYLIKKGLIEA